MYYRPTLRYIYHMYFIPKVYYAFKQLMNLFVNKSTKLAKTTKIAKTNNHINNLINATHVLVSINVD